MDILQNLASLLDQGSSASAPRQGGQGGQGFDLGALAGMLGGGGGHGAKTGAGAGDALGALAGLLGGGGSGGGGGGALEGLAGLLGGGGGSSQGGNALGGLGSLVGALLGSKGGAASGGGAADGIGSLIGALMSNGGGSILNQLLGGGTPPPAPQASRASDSGLRAGNLLRALVYAAKCDGHIDQSEQAAIRDQITKAGLGRDAQRLVDQFMSEDLDPARIAADISSPEEALQIYAMSCAITRMDKFMERNYLDALAKAMGIPAAAKANIERKITG